MRVGAVIGRTFGHFRVTDHIGHGRMGVVYRGEDLNLGRPVALKFLPPDLSADSSAKRRFIQEAKAASSLNHRNIRTIHEIGQTGPAPGEPGDGQLFIAMACYDGETVRERLERDKPPVKQVMTIAAEIANGLSRVHRKGIVRRDIKPGNIMLGEDGDVVILDFGLAKLSGATARSLWQYGRTRECGGIWSVTNPAEFDDRIHGCARTVWGCS